MKYKLLATDMDGTLLMDNKDLSIKNITSLQEAHKRGMEIAICTGRPYSSVKSYLKQLGIPCWVITNNGAVIRNKERKIISVTYIKQQALREIVQVLEGGGIYYHISDEKCSYIKNTAERIQQLQGFIEKTNLPKWKAYLLALWEVRFSGNHGKVDFVDYVEKGKKAASIFIYTKDQKKLEIIKTQVQKIKEIDVTSSGVENVELLDKGATKGDALKRLTELLKIQQHEVIAVGDNLNDLSMIKYAGLGVAMENAAQETIEAADWVTKTNQEHGIAHLIEKVFTESKEEIKV
ncbi:MAG: HAD family phosphatase [Clostridiaceae bacterium]|nr:HAD family phosphatase [Clostridiaceae bacterium]